MHLCACPTFSRQTLHLPSGKKYIHNIEQLNGNFIIVETFTKHKTWTSRFVIKYFTTHRACLDRLYCFHIQLLFCQFYPFLWIMPVFQWSHSAVSYWYCLPLIRFAAQCTTLLVLVITLLQLTKYINYRYSQTTSTCIFGLQSCSCMFCYFTV